MIILLELDYEKIKEPDGQANLVLKKIEELSKTTNKIGILYSANNRQAVELHKNYSKNTYRDIISGSNQAKLFEKLTKMIDPKIVRILPIATIKESNTIIGKVANIKKDREPVEIECIIRDITNLYLHLEDGYSVIVLTNPPHFRTNKYQIGGGVAKYFYKNEPKSIPFKNEAISYGLFVERMIDYFSSIYGNELHIEEKEKLKEDLIDNVFSLFWQQLITKEVIESSWHFKKCFSSERIDQILNKPDDLLTLARDGLVRQEILKNPKDLVKAFFAPSFGFRMKFLKKKYSEGYRRHSVVFDGNCGYTAFGIAREDAVRLLTSHIDLIRGRIRPAVEQALLKSEQFTDYLRKENHISSDISNKVILEGMSRYSQDLSVLRGYINFDVRDRRIDMGWSHPSILQAIAQIQNIEIRLWVIGEKKVLTPHRREGHYDYHATNLENPHERVDLLFVNGNHFERLDLIGYTKDIPATGIYPSEIKKSDTDQETIQLMNNVSMSLANFKVENINEVRALNLDKKSFHGIRTEDNNVLSIDSKNVFYFLHEYLDIPLKDLAYHYALAIKNYDEYRGHKKAAKLQNKNRKKYNSVLITPFYLVFDGKLFELEKAISEEMFGVSYLKLQVPPSTSLIYPENVKHAIKSLLEKWSENRSKKSLNNFYSPLNDQVDFKFTPYFFEIMFKVSTQSHSQILSEQIYLLVENQYNFLTRKAVYIYRQFNKENFYDDTAEPHKEEQWYSKVILEFVLHDLFRKKQESGVFYFKYWLYTQIAFLAYARGNAFLLCALGLALHNTREHIRDDVNYFSEDFWKVFDSTIYSAIDNKTGVVRNNNITRWAIQYLDFGCPLIFQESILKWVEFSRSAGRKENAIKKLNFQLASFFDRLISISAPTLGQPLIQEDNTIDRRFLKWINCSESCRGELNNQTLDELRDQIFSKNPERGQLYEYLRSTDGNRNFITKIEKYSVWHSIISTFLTLSKDFSIQLNYVDNIDLLCKIFQTRFSSSIIKEKNQILQCIKNNKLNDLAVLLRFHILPLKLLDDKILSETSLLSDKEKKFLEELISNYLTNSFEKTEPYESQNLTEQKSHSNLPVTTPSELLHTHGLFGPYKGNSCNFGNPKGYKRHSVASDGNCGYTAFGITREDAAQLLINDINSVRDRVSFAAQQALLESPEFHRYLIRNQYISSDTSDDSISANRERYAQDVNFLREYINFDVRYGNIDAGWAHPSILQAIAQIRNIELRIWVLGEQEVLTPHRREGHYDYYTANLENKNQRVDLLFIDGNHFERLEFVGYTNEVPDTGIYPYIENYTGFFFSMLEKNELEEARIEESEEKHVADYEKAQI